MTITLRGGHTTEDPRLDRLPPTDWEHYDKYPLTAATLPSPPVPVVIGVNWYSAFDSPVKDKNGKWWVGVDESFKPLSNLGKQRGGHCVCLKPPKIEDPNSWWDFYNQGSEGACVGFGTSRMMSLLNRKRYDARWLYKEAQKIDEWAGEAYDGTSVRAGLEIARTVGMRKVVGTRTSNPDPAHGITTYRWARTVHEVLDAMSSTYGHVTMVNSWGRNWPHYVNLPGEVLSQLINEDGEVGLVTDA